MQNVKQIDQKELQNDLAVFGHITAAVCTYLLYICLMVELEGSFSKSSMKKYIRVTV